MGPSYSRQEGQGSRWDLHCTAVRVTGGDPDRVEVAAVHAPSAGLEVWFCPFTNGLTQDALLLLLAECAERAERLRRRRAEVVLLTGSELSWKAWTGHGSTSLLRMRPIGQC